MGQELRNKGVKNDSHDEIEKQACFPTLSWLPRF